MCVTPRRRFTGAPDAAHTLPLILINLATLFSAIGNGIAIVVIPWLVLERTGRATDAAIVAGAAAVPLLVSSLFSGTFVDKFGRRRTSMISDVLSAASVAAIPIFAATTGLSVSLIAALAALGAMFDPAGMAARESMLPAATRSAGWSLDRTNSIYEANYNVAYLIGPGIGGVLIATIGAVTTLWVTATGFLLSIIVVAFIRLPDAGTPKSGTPKSGTPESDLRPTSIWRGTLEGLKFVWNNKLLRTLALVDMAVVALYMPVESVVFPVYFTELDQPAQLGSVLMALAIGGIVGALAYAPLAPMVSRRLIMILAVGVLGIAMLAMALLPPLWVILILAGLQGLMYGPVGPIANYAMQTRSPEHMRGRVVGVMTSSAYAGGPLGYFMAGPLLDQLGIAATFVALSIPIIALAALCATLPALHELDRH